MGKSLRTRQIFDQTDEEVDLHPLLDLSDKNITKLHIRNITSQKWKKTTSRNSKKIKFIKRTRNGQLSELVDSTQLECPICLQLLVMPTMRTCGHLYCFRCLMAHSEHSKRCCICREESSRQANTHSILAESIINNIILPRQKDYFKYLCRSTDSVEWLKRRKVNNLRVGLLVDFCDPFDVWRRGIVYKVFSQQNKIKVQIRFTIKGEELTENVETTSNRLAPYTFFTRARYLLDFAPTLPQFQPVQNQLYSQHFLPQNEDGQFFIGGSSVRMEQPHEDEVVVITSSNSIVQSALDVLNFNIAQSFQMLG